MNISVRHAEPSDVEAVTSMYERLEAEMQALRPVWPLVDGLPHPPVDAVSERIADPDWSAYVAHLDDVPVGFLFSRDEDLLPQANGARVASVRFLYTDRDAREVGVGEAMMSLFLAEAGARGISIFDAHVSPGHRLAKNFFESNGFKARSIVMHRSDL